MNYVTISVTEAKDLVDNDEELFILDVRNPDEFEAGHIFGAYLIPVNDISTRKNELPKNKSTPILVYCRSGTRSATASTALDSLGYNQVNNMNNGFIAWKDAGYPYETGPFIRQMTSNTNITEQSSSEHTSSSISKSEITTPAFDISFILLTVGVLLIITKKQR